LSDSTISSRLLTFANSCIAIDYSGGRAAELVDFLYGFLPKEQPGLPSVRLRLLSSAGNSLRLVQNQRLLAEGKEEAVIVEYLLGQSCYQLATTSKNGLLLHAAAVLWHQGCTIFVGASGVGKSTLTAWLLSQHFTYMTDELVFIPENSLEIDTFARPLNLKKRSRTVLHNVIDYGSLSEGIICTPHIDLVSPLIFQNKLPQHRGRLHLIIFPRYSSTSHYNCNKLSPAQTGLLLMKHLLNARNLPQHGFAQVVQIAKTIVAYEVSYSSFADLESAVQMLKEQLSANPIHII